MLPLIIIIVALLWKPFAFSIRIAFCRHDQNDVIRTDRYDVIKRVYDCEIKAGEVTIVVKKCKTCGTVRHVPTDRVYF